jgi:glycosyltransferase involved in cell wall biosynthesis
MSVLEAMAYGKTVVASDIGGIPELVAHGETGLLFSPGDAEALTQCLVRLTDNPDLRLQYGRAARRRVEERFSLERHNPALLRLYSKVIGGPCVRPQPDTSHPIPNPVQSDIALEDPV